MHLKIVLLLAALATCPLAAQTVCCLSKPMVPAGPPAITVNPTTNVVSLSVPVTLPPNTGFISATLVKNTWSWQSGSMCGPTTPTPANGYFLLAQPPATITGTTIATNPPPTTGYRRMGWTINWINSTTTANLKMDVQVSPAGCVNCNPKASAYNLRTSTTCVYFESSEKTIIGGTTGCSSTCPALMNYTVTYNLFGVNSTAWANGCP